MPQAFHFSRPERARSFRIFFVWAAALALAGSAAGGETGPEIRTARTLRHTQKNGRVLHRAPLALNVDRDCGLEYAASRSWVCARLCPDGNCDHRPREPVWDYRYAGGPVPQEDDLLELEVIFSGAGGTPVLDVISGAECVRLWPSPAKGYKRDIHTAPLWLEGRGGSRKVYAEGIAPGTAVLRLSEGGRSFDMALDVVRLTESQGGKRKYIYEPGEVTVKLEPAETFHGYPYYSSIVWSGSAEGKKGGHLVLGLDPGDDPALRRAVYTVTAEVVPGLVLERKIRVRQKTYTGTPTAETIPGRRREIESLLPIPASGFLPTALPNTPDVPFSQAWFEKKYTGSSSPGDPVKPIAEARLQYAALDTNSKRWGFASTFRLPYAIFITPLAYELGLKLEDLRGVAAHELRHMQQHHEMYNATGMWHILCRNLPYETSSWFMEADASSASLHFDGTWRYLHHSARRTAENYRKAAAAVLDLPSQEQITAGIKLLQDIYSGLTEDMEAFKREDYECYIRPPQTY